MTRFVFVSLSLSLSHVETTATRGFFRNSESFTSSRLHLVLIRLQLTNMENKNITKFQEGFAVFANSKLLSDFKFVVEGEEFPVHKLLLAGKMMNSLILLILSLLP